MTKTITKPGHENAASNPEKSTPKLEPKATPPELSLTFTAISSKVIHSHSVFDITLFVEKKKENEQEKKDISSGLHFSAKLTRDQESFSSLKEISVSQGKSATLSIKIPELKSPAGSEYNLILTVRDDRGAKQTFEGKIFTSKFKVPLLAHTDKGVYKPGDTVKFRVVVLNRNFRPFPDSESKVNVKIFDPDQNLVKLWTEAPTQTGIFSSEFQLSTDPIFGDWKINYEALIKTHSQNEGEKGAMGFSVEKYVLPKYKMSVKLPPFLAFTYEKISVRVEVKYTHGGGVKGQVKLTPSLTDGYWERMREQNQNKDHNPKRNQSSTHADKKHATKQLPNPLEKIFPIDDSGILQTQIEFKSLFGKLKELPIYTFYIFVHVEFTDGVTGKKTTEVPFVKIFNYPYKMRIWSEPSRIIKGLDFTFFVKVMMQDDSLITDKFRDVVKITHELKSAVNLKEKTSTSKNKEKHTKPSEKTSVHKIDAQGVVKLTFDANTTSHLIHIPTQFDRFHVKFRELTAEPMVDFYFDDLGLTILINNKGNHDDGNPNSIMPIAKTASDGTCQIEVSVIHSQPFQSLNYFITGIGAEMTKILAFGTKDFPSLEKIHQLKIPCPQETFVTLPSSVTEKHLCLFIFIIFEKLETRKCYFLIPNSNSNSNSKPIQNPNSKKMTTINENFLDISLSEEKREPAQNVTLKIHTGKNSLVALKAVDESVLILKNNGDIDSSAITDAKINLVKKGNELNGLDKDRVSRSIDLINDQVLRVLTNAPLDIIRSRDYRSQSFVDDDDDDIVRPRKKLRQGKIGTNKSGREHSSQERFARENSEQENVAPGASVRVRTEFPETWIWEESFSQSGTLNLSKIVPDSLTSWTITGFSISKELGIAALSTPKKLVVNREFFLVLNLPYSVIQGEILHLHVVVHNHNSEKKEIQAEITLENSEGKFEFESAGANDKSSKSKSMTKKVTVKPDATSFVTFLIKPVKFGVIDLKVKGSGGSKGSNYSDALSQPLRVVPPGERQSQSVAVLLTPSEKNIQLVAVFPEHSIKVDDSIKISAISDLLGATIDNMDNLIAMPNGCGEQNMMNFVVDIVVLGYLEFYSSVSKKALRPGVKEKAIKFLESGYQRELSYRHKDGSFSCFGPSDPNSSTWLTAFVLRSFLKASAFIKIEDHVISQAVEFLLGQQDEKSGSFEEKGTVHHSELVGNSGSKGVALTAFCLLALLQAKESLKLDSYSKNIQKGLNFIVQGTKDNNAGTESDLYALILTTYALHLANHKEKDKYFQKMEKAVRKEGDLMFWGHSDSSAHDKVKPVWIEMTGYSLLIHMLREGNSKSNSESKTLPIVKWLLKHRNSNGGFISTQDTVVGLSAVAQFAKGTKGKDGALVNLNIVAKHGKEELKIRVNAETSIVRQEFVLPSSTSSVSLTASGKGSALVQLTWYYFVQNPVKQPAFSLDVTALERPGSGIALKICTSFILAGKESKSKSESKSNMAIVEVNFPSGYSVDKEMLTSLKKLSNYKRHETENQDNRLNIYFESMSKSPTCVELEGLQIFKVLNAMKTYVSVYDYYDPTRRARTFYPLPFSSSASHLKSTKHSMTKPIEKIQGNNTPKNTNIVNAPASIQKNQSNNNKKLSVKK